MELIEPKAKKRSKFYNHLPLPIVVKKDDKIKKFKGIFNGFAIVINDNEDGKSIISMGCFGKANLSKSFPNSIPMNGNEILRNRQFKHRNQYINKSRMKKVIVISDSDSDENEDQQIHPKYELDYSGLQENIWLSLEEAFFLSNEIECLQIEHNDLILDNSTVWNLFKTTQSNFIRNYVVYYYFRSKKWIVKPGIKFGGDFLLYKESPSCYHASYVVLIEENLKSTFGNKIFDNTSLIGLNRLCAAAGKELLVCRIKWPNSPVTFTNLQDVEIEEILFRRWICSQER